MRDSSQGQLFPLSPTPPPSSAVPKSPAGVAPEWDDWTVEGAGDPPRMVPVLPDCKQCGKHESASFCPIYDQYLCEQCKAANRVT